MFFSFNISHIIAVKQHLPQRAVKNVSMRLNRTVSHFSKFPMPLTFKDVEHKRRRTHALIERNVRRISAGSSSPHTPVCDRSLLEVLQQLHQNQITWTHLKVTHSAPKWLCSLFSGDSCSDFQLLPEWPLAVTPTTRVSSFYNY